MKFRAPPEAFASVVSKLSSSQTKNNARIFRVLSLTVRPSLPKSRPTEVICQAFLAAVRGSAIDVVDGSTRT